MERKRLKLCGVTCEEDIQCAVENKVWAIGFIFHKDSPRYISSDKALDLIKSIPWGSHILRVGVFVDTPYKEIVDIKEKLNLDLVQVYKEYDDCPVEDKAHMIRSINVGSEEDVPPQDVLDQYAYISLEPMKGEDGKVGGTGQLANWDIAKVLSKNVKLILAGGLSPGNIAKAVEFVAPYAIDVCTEVESSPGKKDHKKLKLLVSRYNDSSG